MGSNKLEMIKSADILLPRSLALEAFLHNDTLHTPIKFCENVLQPETCQSSQSQQFLDVFFEFIFLLLQSSDHCERRTLKFCLSTQHNFSRGFNIIIPKTWRRRICCLVYCHDFIFFN